MKRRTLLLVLIMMFLAGSILSSCALKEDNGSETQTGQTPAETQSNTSGPRVIEFSADW